MIDYCLICDDQSLLPIFSHSCNIWSFIDSLVFLVIYSGKSRGGPLYFGKKTAEGRKAGKTSEPPPPSQLAQGVDPLLIYGYTCIKWPVPSSLDSSVGRALQRYRGDYGFKSRSGLHFFRLLISQLLKVVYVTAMINHFFTAVPIYIIFNIFTCQQIHNFATPARNMWPSSLTSCCFGS